MQTDIYKPWDQYNINSLVVVDDLSSISNNETVKQSIIEKHEEYLILRVPDSVREDVPYEYIAEISIAEFKKLLGKNQLDKITHLFIGEINPEDLPFELWQLTNLTSLNISINELTVLPAKIGQLTNLTSLDLSWNKLTVLPREIGQLTNLISLNISNNQLTSLLTEIGQLIRLTSIDLSWNKLKILPTEISQLVNLTSLNLQGNEFVVLPFGIGQLTNLTSLCLQYNQLTRLPAEIGQLTNLTFFSLQYNQLDSLPAEIGHLAKLTSLDISINSITTLPIEIGLLTNLSSLNISNNQLTLLPIEIGQLTRLEILMISNQFSSGYQVSSRNKIKKIPTEFLLLTSLKTLDLRDNALDIPPEILERVNEPQAILNYLTQLRQENKRALNETKVLVVGQGSVGKTSVIRRLTFDTFDVSQAKTEGISIEHWQVRNQANRNIETDHINLNIWDFGGQEIMHATHQFFLTKRSLYLLVLDARLTQEENRVEYWLKIIQSFGGSSPVLIVGNKCDQHQLDIDRAGLQKKYPNITGIVETSAATGAGIKELKDAIIAQVNALPHVHDLLPESWFRLKNELEAIGRETNFITHDKYIELCEVNRISDEFSQHTLIGFLHDLGVVLHFQDDPRLEALGILNPQWVTNGVYKILNSKSLFQSRGALSITMLNDILNLPEYPREKRFFIIDIMKKFELCFDIDADKTFLVPDLLPKDEPALNFEGLPAFEYHYPVLPSSVLTRFIVRMNQKIEANKLWRSGVLLKIGDNRALVKADTEDRIVRIAIDGAEHTRRDALSAIRYQLDEIHASIKGLNPEKYVPVPGAPNANPLKYEYLLKLERAGQDNLSIEDGKRLVKINVHEILSGVESESGRRENGRNEIHIMGLTNVEGNIIIGKDKDSKD